MALLFMGCSEREYHGRRLSKTEQSCSSHGDQEVERKEEWGGAGTRYNIPAVTYFLQ
jgi:hypothetical protein